MSKEKSYCIIFQRKINKGGEFAWQNPFLFVTNKVNDWNTLVTFSKKIGLSLHGQKGSTLNLEELITESIETHIPKLQNHGPNKLKEPEPTLYDLEALIGRLEDLGVISQEMGESVRETFIKTKGELSLEDKFFSNVEGNEDKEDYSGNEVGIGTDSEPDDMKDSDEDDITLQNSHYFTQMLSNRNIIGSFILFIPNIS